MTISISAGTEKEIAACRCVVNLPFFLKQIQGKHDTGLRCDFLDMTLIDEQKQGMHCNWKFRCRVCSYKQWIKSEEIDDNTVPVNTAAVNGIIAIGKKLLSVSCLRRDGTVSIHNTYLNFPGSGFAQLDKLTSTLDHPCMSHITYIKEEAKESKDEKEERDHAIASGNIDTDRTPLYTLVVSRCSKDYNPAHNPFIFFSSALFPSIKF